MIVYNGRDKNVLEATLIANDLLKGDRGFYSFLLNKRNTYTDIDSPIELVVKDIQTTYKIYEVTVVVKRWWNPFASNLASFYYKRPREIRLNKWRINRSKHSLVGSIVHEFIHLADYGTEINFGHSQDSSEDRSMSVPYFSGNVAKKLSEAYY